GDDLLPVTFRNLVTNDLVQHLGLPLTNFLDLADVPEQVLSEKNRRILQGLDVLDQLQQHFDNELARGARPDAAASAAWKFFQDLPDADKLRLCAAVVYSD